MRARHDNKIQSKHSYLLNFYELQKFIKMKPLKLGNINEKEY